MVENVKIYDLEESIKASGYPMQTSPKRGEVTEKDIKRCHNLCKATEEGNGAHNQFLSGIIVSFDLTCSNKMWVEAERYRFLTFVSSESTMHRIAKFDLNNAYVDYVDPRVIEIMKEKVEEYNANPTKEKYLELLYTNPAGFRLTARITTNYRCLRNIYIQRRDHRLPEWREFCAWIETLPYFEEFIKPTNLE